VTRKAQPNPGTPAARQARGTRRARDCTGTPHPSVHWWGEPSLLAPVPPTAHAGGPVSVSPWIVGRALVRALAPGCPSWERGRRNGCTGRTGVVTLLTPASAAGGWTTTSPSRCSPRSIPGSSSNGSSRARRSGPRWGPRRSRPNSNYSVRLKKRKFSQSGRSRSSRRASSASGFSSEK
jgi:hypothetical protein